MYLAKVHNTAERENISTNSKACDSYILMPLVTLQKVDMIKKSMFSNEQCPQMERTEMKCPFWFINRLMIEYFGI